ncbi:MAG: hypothetical protein WKF32_03530 [Thermoleophilaceae bacterium]
MSARPPSPVSDLAARQVEQIVGAAQEAAEQIRELAQRELEDLRHRAEREGDQIREKATRDSETERNAARKEAIFLTQDARRDAELILAEANAETAKLREQTEAAVQGRVASAEKAAADVLTEARALSGGLTQLGKSLESQADRILRDVTAAHKRMQADLRIESGDGGGAPRAAPTAQQEPPRERSARSEASGAGRRANPFDDLDLPSWDRPKD